MLNGSLSKNSYIVKGTKLLETIIRQVPGVIIAYLLKAKAKMALGEFSEAVASINKILELD
jgi:hypothetical protein